MSSRLYKTKIFKAVEFSDINRFGIKNAVKIIMHFHFRCVVEIHKNQNDFDRAFARARVIILNSQKTDRIKQKDISMSLIFINCLMNRVRRSVGGNNYQTGVVGNT